MFQFIFLLLSSIINIYSFIIFVRIIFSWLSLKSPQINNSKIITFLAGITDPYLNWFRRFSILKIGFLDFSAIIGIVLLYFISNVFRIIGLSGSISLASIFILLLSSVWSIISSILFIFTIFLIVRFFFIQFNKYSNFFYNLDGYIEPYLRKFARLFTKKFTSYKVNIIIATLFLVLFQVAGRYLFNFLIVLVSKTIQI